MFAAARADGVHPDVRSFATLINGYAQQDKLEQALEVRVRSTFPCQSTCIMHHTRNTSCMTPHAAQSQRRVLNVHNRSCWKT